MCAPIRSYGMGSHKKLWDGIPCSHRQPSNQKRWGGCTEQVIAHICVCGQYIRSDLELAAEFASDTATHCNTLQHTASHCITLYRTAAHCNTLQHTATHCNTLQQLCIYGPYGRCNLELAIDFLSDTATRCNTLQHTATHCNTLQHPATHCNTLQHTATYCNTLKQRARY